MVICPHCGHTWSPKTASPWLTCSWCRRKFKREAVRVETVAYGGADLAGECGVCNTRSDALSIGLVAGSAVLACPSCMKR